MSYQTYNIVVKDSENFGAHSLKQELEDVFKFFSVREFFTPFNGIVCQSDDHFKERPFENFPDNYFKRQEEVAAHFTDFEEKLLRFSTKHPNIKIAYIEVDCFGGKCGSKGYILENGTKTLNVENHHSGHIQLLKNLDQKYSSWFFYAFTRSFFHDKGGINGEILNFSLSAIGMSFNMEIGNDPHIQISATHNELLIINTDHFELYFMSLGRERIKSMGRLFKSDAETVNRLMSLLTGNLDGIEHYIEIDNFETAEKFTVANIAEDKFAHVASDSYRKEAFNERPFEYPTNGKSATDAPDQESNGGFLGWIFKKIFGR